MMLKPFFRVNGNHGQKGGLKDYDGGAGEMMEIEESASLRLPLPPPPPPPPHLPSPPPSHQPFHFYYGSMISSTCSDQILLPPPPPPPFSLPSLEAQPMVIADDGSII